MYRLISAGAMTALALWSMGCSGGGSSGQGPLASTAAGATANGELPGFAEGEEGSEAASDGAVSGGLAAAEFNEAYVQLEAIKQPHALPEQFYGTAKGEPLASLATQESAKFEELGTSGTGYTMVGRDGALLQYGTPTVINSLKVAASKWAALHPDLPMHMRALSPRDTRQQFVGNLYECVETYGVGHIFARRVDTFADAGTPVEWVTKYSSEKNGVVWHHMGKEVDFQEFKSGALNKEMVDLINAEFSGIEESRAYIFDVLAENNDVILNKGSDGPRSISSPLHMDFHGPKSNFESEDLFDDYNSYRKDLYYEQATVCKEALEKPAQ